VVLVHFPTQLLIILLLEATKSVLSVTTLLTSATFFFARFADPNTDLVHVFRSVGLNYTTESNKLDQISNTTDESFLRIYALAFEQLFTEFNIIDDKVKGKFDTYINAPFAGSPAYADAIYFAGSVQDPSITVAPDFDQLVNGVIVKQISPIVWIAGVAGAFLVSLAILMALNGLPKNRYAFFSALSRVLTGTGLMMLSWLELAPDTVVSWVVNGWFLPSIVVFYVLQFFIDFALSFFCARSIHFKIRESAEAENNMVKRV